MIIQSSLIFRKYYLIQINQENASQSMILVISSQSYFLHFLLLIFIISLFFGQCSSYYGGTVSDKTYSTIVLKHFQWRYIRVDLPQLFSSLALSLESNVDLNPRKLGKVKKSRLPVLCLGEGSPSIPDVNNNITVFNRLSNLSFGNVQGLQKAELCYPMEKNMYLKLTNEQILPGVWYFAFFNGIGPTRTQAKMIDRGKVYSLSANISIGKCHSLTLGGPNCDQIINNLTCAEKFLAKNLSDSVSTKKMKKLITCSDSEGSKCLTYGETNIYALNVQDITEMLTIAAKMVKSKGKEVYLKCYARYGAIPSSSFHDFSANISDDPLIIHFPKVGSLYFSINLVNASNQDEGVRDIILKRACFSLDLRVFQCPQGKLGLNCTSDIYMLQKIHNKEPSTSFEANYKPTSGNVSSHFAEFPLDCFFTNENSDIDWTYFVLNVPHGSSGGNLHVKLVSGGSKINYQVYARYMGLPSLDNWDFFYANSTSQTSDSSFFKLYDTTEKVISFYILYVREGTWSIGLRRIAPFKIISKNQTMALISIEGCPKGCGPHGTCKSRYDISGSLQYSYCSCDEDHGGFDCSVTIVSHLRHIWGSAFLISSNTAALFPALWCLRQKAYAEWVVFMSSGISSGIYHACDSGNPCLLSLDVLQFMDFWLSFMAVVSTSLCLTNLGEVSKRAINMGLAIITALMARNGATKASNIAIIIGIGGSGLILGLLIEFGLRFRSYSLSGELRVNVINRWQAMKGWLGNFVQTFVKHFRWGFLIAAFISLSLAKFCWDYETPENYWILHSFWHITIYTSSFLFLCSKSIPVDNELVRQNSTPREG